MPGQTALKVACTALLGCAVSAWPALAEPSQRTRIEVDQKAKAIHFIVDGVPVARLVSTGLIVSGDISFDGQLTDRKIDR